MPLETQPLYKVEIVGSPILTSGRWIVRQLIINSLNNKTDRFIQIEEILDTITPWRPGSKVSLMRLEAVKEFDKHYDPAMNSNKISTLG